MSISSPRRTTLSAIASRANVSQATVSKVINERVGVSQETRARVQEVIRELGYRPPASGRSASRGRRELAFELLIDPLDMSNAYMYALLGGITRAADQADATLVTRRVDRIARVPVVEWAQSLADHGRVGVIEVTTEYSAQRERALSAVGIPMVLIDPIDVHRTSTLSVGADNYGGAVLATEHLLSLGHKRIEYVPGPVNAACDSERIAGWRDAMTHAGVSSITGLPLHGPYSFEHGSAVAEVVLSATDRPTAIFAGSDASAMGVIEAARRLRLRVPEDLSVIGFDDTILAQCSAPRLTTVHQPVAEIGRTAVELILRQFRGESFQAKRIQLATWLALRDSTAPPPRAS